MSTLFESYGLIPPEPEEEVKPKNNASKIGDLGRSLKSGVLQLPGMATGLADIVPALVADARPFTKMADIAGEATGFQPGKWAKDKSGYSDGYQESQKAVDESWKGVEDAVKDVSKDKLDVVKQLISDSPQLLKAYLSNPLYTVNQVVESLPAMAAGGVISRGLLGAGAVTKGTTLAEGAIGPTRPGVAGIMERTVGKTLAPEIAGGLGEGITQAGQAMDQSTGTDQRQNALAALAAGAGDAIIATGAGHLARKVGLDTANTLMADGGIKSKLSLPRRVAGGMASEGLLQELPQSMQEQAWQNYADGKPVGEGVLRAGVEGALSGAVMGGGANLMSGKNEPASGLPPVLDEKPAGPMTRAVQAAGLQPADHPAGPDAQAQRELEAEQRRQDIKTEADIERKMLAEEMRAAQSDKVQGQAQSITGTDMASLVGPRGADPIQSAMTHEEPAPMGPFSSRDESDMFIRTQKVSGQSSIQAITHKYPDGTYGPVTRGSPFYEEAKAAQPKKETKRATDEKPESAVAAPEQTADGSIPEDVGQSGETKPIEAQQPLTDLKNPVGEPFKTKMAADRAAKTAGDGAIVAPVEGGFVVRLSTPTNPKTLGTQTNATAGPGFTANDALKYVPNTQEKPTTEATAQVAKEGATEAPQPAAVPKPAGATEVESSGVTTGKWFTSKKRADGYITRNKLGATHSVQQDATDPKKFNIVINEGKTNGTQAPEAVEAKAQGQKAASLQDAPDLRSKAKLTENAGDIGVVMGDGKVNFVSLADAVDTTRYAIASGVKPVPFQIHNNTNIRLGDVDRVLAEIKKDDTGQHDNQRSLEKRVVETDKKIDALEPDDVKATAEKSGIKTTGKPIEEVRDSLKQEHPDDIKKAIEEVSNNKAKKQKDGADMQTEMDAAGWIGEVNKQDNTIWVKRVDKERYTAKFSPETGSMEITVLVDGVDTQIGSFKVDAAKNAAKEANRAIDIDVKESQSNSANAEDGKQPNSTGDAGQELTYNKRNRIKTGIKWSDIEDKDVALRVKETNKQNVYPRPDYPALVDGGMNPIAAHIVKQSYDSLASSPKTSKAPTDEQLKAYIQGVHRFMDGVMEWANDGTQIKQFLAKVAARAKAYSGSASGVITSISDLAERPSKSLLDTVYPDGWKVHREELSLIGGNKSLAALQPSTEEAMKAVKDIGKGWPSKQEAWKKRGYRVVDGSKLEPTYYESSRNDKKVVFVNLQFVEGNKSITVLSKSIPAESKNDQQVKDWVKEELQAYKPRFLVLDKLNRVKAWGLSKDEAEQQARDLTKRNGSGGIRDAGTSVENATREGVDHRMPGEDISSEKLRDTFGFKGVNFGNWMKGESNQSERQLHLNHVYDSFMDLASILGVPPKAMSLNGMLGIAVGAQGTGKYAAHFVPGVNEINLTRTSGAGSLAHEWGHALDHYFARLANLTREDRPFLTEHAGLGATMKRTEMVDGAYKTVDRPRFSGEIRPEIVSAFKSIVDSMNKRPLSRAEYSARAAERVERYKRQTAEWLGAIRRNFVASKASDDQLSKFDALAEKVKSSDLGDGSIAVSRGTYLSPAVSSIRDLYKEVTGRVYPIEQIKGLEANASSLKRLIEAKDEAKDHIPQLVETDYRRAALNLDGKKGGKTYWSTNLEMFARAFDAFVSDKLSEKASKNTYLSHAGRTGVTVPEGVERTAINESIQKLVDTIDTKDGESGNVALFSRNPFYSAMERSIQSMSMAAAPAQGWKDTIKGLVNKGAIKVDEVEWSGLNDWLDLQQGKVSKTDVVDFIAQNGVKVTAYDTTATTRALGGRTVIDESGVTAEKLEQHLGKELTSKLIEQSADEDGDRQISGLDLKVGGEGMKTFYDKIVPNAVNALLKKVGGERLGEIDLGNFRESAFTGEKTEEFDVEHEGQLGFTITDAMREKASGGLPLFNRQSNFASAQKVSDVTTIVDTIRERWSNAPETVVISGMQDPKVPQAVRDEDAQQKSQGASGEPEGFFYGGKVYLVASQIHSVSDAARVLFHEALGHYGLRGVFGSDLDSILNHIAMARPSEMRAKATEYGKDLSNAKQRLQVAEEVLAEMAQTNPKIGFVRRALAAIRAWLRKHGFSNLRLTDDEIVHNYLIPARGWVEHGDVSTDGFGVLAMASRNGPMFSRSATFSGYAKQAVDKLNENISHPGKLSWWDKTVGSMYHLAERSAPFKKVFDSAQGFLNDVSFYASEAADHAPKILPKLETMRDLMKTPITAADNKAIAAPIFQGTLSWTRDENGKPISMDDLEARYGRFTPEQKGQMLLRKGIVTAEQLKRWKESKIDVFDGAVRNRFEASYMTPGIVWSDAELKDQFKLTSGQIDLYREFRKATDASLDSMAKSEMLRYVGKDAADFEDRVMSSKDAAEAGTFLAEKLREMANTMPDRSGELMDSANGVIERSDKVARLKSQGYAPLSRFGRYTVDAVVDGERKYFSLFETAKDANRAASSLRAEYGASNVAQGTLSQREFEMFQGITPESLELFGNMLGLDSTGDKAQDEVFQQYLKLTKANRSAMKRMIHRKGIAGYSEDVGRVLASFVYSNARQTAAALHMGDLGEAINEIPKSQGELKDVAVGLADYIKKPREEAQAVRGLLFAQYLGGSVASAAVNFTQPLAISIPYLSQFGGVSKAASAWYSAVNDMARGKDLGPELTKALKVAEEQGVVAPQEVHQLMAQARGTATLMLGDGTKTGEAVAGARNGLTKLMLAWGKLFGLAETINRRSTFIAAYRLAVQQKIDNPTAFATKAVNETQFINNKANRPQWARGAIGATLFTFKSYSLNYLELLTRMAGNGPEGKKAAALMLGTLVLMAGTGGLPFEEDAEDVIDAIAQRLGYNFSTKKAKQEFLEELFGQAGAQFIDKGLTGLPGSPIDVSGRMSMANLIPGTGLLLQKKDHTQDAVELLGPVGDLAKRSFQAGNNLLTGDVAGAVLSISPKAVYNLHKGADMAQHDMYRDDRGFKVLEASDLEAAMKAVGFQPQSVAKVQESNYLNQRAKDFYSMAAEKIRADWAKGIFEQDTDQVDQARAELSKWNEQNPDQRISANMPAILKRVREMRMTKEQRILATAPKGMRAYMRQEAAKSRETAEAP